MDAEVAKERARERAARIQKKVPIVDLLLHYGYDVREEFEEREQQFSCDLHGDGTDNKPSARVYPDSASWYCFACGVTRDAIKTVQDKEDLNFSQACWKIEKMWDLPHPSSWDPSAEYDNKPKVEPEDVIHIDTSETFEEEQAQTERVLLYLTHERILEQRLCASIWELFDRVCWSVSKEELTGEKGKASLAKLRTKVISLGAKALKEAS